MSPLPIQTHVTLPRLTAERILALIDEAQIAISDLMPHLSEPEAARAYDICFPLVEAARLLAPAKFDEPPTINMLASH